MKNRFLGNILALTAMCSALPCVAQTQSAKQIPHSVRLGSAGTAWIGGAPYRSVTVHSPRLQSAAKAGPKWVPLVNQMPNTSDPNVTPGAALLLTDGTVFAQDAGTADWWRLKPDVFGSYINGTWTQAASMPYAPLYFASAVLPDGRVLVEGGEFVDFTFAETTQGALYDPSTDTWQPFPASDDWSSGGDMPSVVLANGTFMLGNRNSQNALLSRDPDFGTLFWAATGSTGGGNPPSSNDESGWTLLSSGKVLTLDTGTNFELYDPSTGVWTTIGSTGVPLKDTGEIGPQVLRPDGTVFVAGGSGHTGIYDSKTGRWKAGPDFPASIDGQLDVADGPGALLPNGNVLVAASPGTFKNGTHFFEFDGRRLTEVASRPDAAANSSFDFVALILPTGEILVNDINDGNGAMVYTSGGGYHGDWVPVIRSVPTTLHAGASYSLTGQRLNGMSQGAFYGDDFQSATNYPLVRITNNATGHVFYARTHDHSSMAVAQQTDSTTQFDVPAGIETGPSRLEVVTNGIPSHAVGVLVLP